MPGLLADVFGRFGGPDFDKLKRCGRDELEALIDAGALWSARLTPTTGVLPIRRFIGTAYVAVDAEGVAEFGGAAVLPDFRGQFPGLALDLSACALGSFILNTSGGGDFHEVISHVHVDNERVARLIMRRGGFERVREIALDPAEHPGFERMPVDASGAVRGVEYRLTDRGRVNVLKRLASLVDAHGLSAILPPEDIDALLAELARR